MAKGAKGQSERDEENRQKRVSGIVGAQSRAKTKRKEEKEREREEEREREVGINSHNILRGGIRPVSSPCDALEHGLGLITPNHPKTCSRSRKAAIHLARSFL